MSARDLDEQHVATWAKYQRLRHRLSERLNRELARETGLSEADFEILTALTGSPDESVRALALRCGLEWEKSRLSHQLRRMEQRGLVVREHCEEDNRGATIRVTDEGRALAEQAKSVHDRAVQRYVYDALTPDQLAALGEIADTILTNLGEPPHRS